MVHIFRILKNMHENPEKVALIYGREQITYHEFLDQIENWRGFLKSGDIGSGTVCAIVGDYTPATCAAMFALMLEGCILAPFSWANRMEHESLFAIAGIQVLVHFDKDGTWEVRRDFDYQQNALIQSFRKTGDSGLVVFSSGSTGKPKGILHNCDKVAKKFSSPRPGWRTILFLMIDHFGGFNTLLSAFAYGGVAICLTDRSPDTVCKAIEAARATLLPTTPTFLNYLFNSGCYRGYDLSSVKMITYGTEVMPESTLEKTRKVFSNASIKQTYGLSELGVLRSKSESDNSLWVKIGGDGFETKVKNNLLYVRSEANMVGYLNAPDPFDEDGWLCTDDEVEVKDGYMRILGRKSELINVGGLKVYPAEVETVLLEAPGILEASVYGEKHAVTGNIVVANIAIEDQESLDTLKERLRKHCSRHLAPHKIPVRFNIVSKEQIYGSRFKKRRPKSGL